MKSCNKMLIKMPALIVSAFLVTACGASIGSGEKPNITGIDSALLEECDDPVNLPDEDMKQKNNERYWRKDRTSLVTCKAGKKALVKEVTTLLSDVTGEPQPKAKANIARRKEFVGK